MITFNIAGQELTVSSPVIVSETKKYITASFTFSNDWDDITDKILHYYNGETYYSIPIVNDELTSEDNFQLSNGLWKFYIHGVNQNGVRITTTPVFLTVKEFGNFEGEIYPDAPQHIVDRLLLLIRTDGDGSLFLANDGTYKGVTVSSQEIAEAVERYLETHPVESVWGDISGDIEDQTDLAEALADLNEAISSIVVPSALSQLLDDSTHRLVTDSEKATWTAKSDFSGDYDDLNNKPNIPSIEGLATEEYVDNAVSGKADASDIPTNLSDLQDDATHRLVTDDEKESWNGKQDALVSGTNIKTINGESVLGSGNIVIQGGGGSWGSITGTLSDQTDLQNALNEKADETDIPSMVDSEFTNAFRLSSLDATTRQAIIDILVGMGFEKSELQPDPIIVQSGAWQYKTTPTKGYIIIGKDDDTHDEAMFVRMVSGYGFPVTLNTIYGNAYDVSSHRQTDDADSEYSQYPVDSVSRLPEGGTVHDVNKIVIDNNLGEIAQHGYKALWNSETVTDETWNTLFATYQSGGGLKTRQQMIDALKTDYASTDISQGATYLTDGRQSLKEDLRTVIQTLGTWGVMGTFEVDGITVCGESTLNVPAFNVARQFNFWASGPVTTWGTARNPWNIPRRSHGLSSVSDVETACSDAYNGLCAIEVFGHQMFTGHGTQAEWNTFKSVLDEIKDWVDEGKIEVVTRYEYSQLGEIVEHPITSLQFSTAQTTYSTNATITDSDFVCKAVLDDLSTIDCESDMILDYSNVDTSVAGIYTATLQYRGFSATCSVTVVAQPIHNYILENKSYSGSEMVRLQNYCSETLSVEIGKKYHLEFDFVATTTVQYSNHYAEFMLATTHNGQAISWDSVQAELGDGTTSDHITLETTEALRTATLDSVIRTKDLKNGTIANWSITNLYMWEITS